MEWVQVCFDGLTALENEVQVVDFNSCGNSELSQAFEMIFCVHKEWWQPGPVVPGGHGLHLIKKRLAKSTKNASAE